MSRRMNESRPSPPRGGFSLVEVLAVIAIISILVGLLLAAVGPVRTRLRVADVRTEISGLESGIAQFAAEFGQEPPSFIILYEAATGDPSWNLDTGFEPARLQSRTTIRQLWPQFDFTLNRDIDGDGNKTGRFVLTGDECLLFFLGGLETITFYNAGNYGDKDGDGFADPPVASGFSKNPTDPFARDTTSKQIVGTTVGPFFEFDPDRMIDFEAILGPSADPTPGGTNDGVHSYADKFPETQVPYLYLSSYQGRGFRPLIDGNMNESADASALPTLQTPSELGGVYLRSASVEWNDRSYQIISAGNDGLFGEGGLWSTERKFADNTNDTSGDRDNVTNFTGGTLE